MDHDPSDQMAAAEQRCDGLLRQMRRRYPAALGQLTQFATAKGTAPGPDYNWPDWCWLPMAASGHVVQQSAPVLLPADPRVKDIARLAALSAWRLTRGLYWVEDQAAERHVDAVWQDQACLVPGEVRLRAERYQAQLPQHCVYIVIPDLPRLHPAAADGMALAGVFVHLEHDARTGRPELRLLFDRDGTWEGLEPVPVLLDRLTLSASAREGASAIARMLHPAGGASERLVAALSVWPFLVWPFVEAVCDPALAIGRWDLPGEEPRRARPPWYPTVKTTTWWRVSAQVPKAALRPL